MEKGQIIINSLTESQIVAMTIFGEARGEPIEGKVAVASILRNRVDAKRFGGSFREVCLKHRQFTCWSPDFGDDNAKNYARMIETAETLLTVGQTPPDILRECLWVATGIMNHILKDRVKGATHYATLELLASPKAPSWAQGYTPVCTVGSHAFFKGIA